MNRRRASEGFTLLEILIAVSILGIAITVILQLFSANLRSLKASEEYVGAAIRAETIMRETLDTEDLKEGTHEGTTQDGYRYIVTATEILQERTENLPVRLLEIRVVVAWASGAATKSHTLTTQKTIVKKI